MIQLTSTLKMTTAKVVKTSVTVSNNSPLQDYVHRDDQTQPTLIDVYVLEIGNTVSSLIRTTMQKHSIKCAHYRDVYAISIGKTLELAL